MKQSVVPGRHVAILDEARDLRELLRLGSRIVGVGCPGGEIQSPSPLSDIVVDEP